MFHKVLGEVGEMAIITQLLFSLILNSMYFMLI